MTFYHDAEFEYLMFRQIGSGIPQGQNIPSSGIPEVVQGRSSVHAFPQIVSSERTSSWIFLRFISFMPMRLMIPQVLLRLI